MTEILIALIVGFACGFGCGWQVAIEWALHQMHKWTGKQ